MSIYLIRHGKTEANEKHLYCGSTDLPLSPLGAAELRPLPVDTENLTFITSGMRRTNQTLRALFGDVPFREEPLFREMDFGIFEMKSYLELKDTPEYQLWLTGDNAANLPPRGESAVQMKTRVLEAFSQLQGNVCIVTHGGVIAAIMEQLFPDENKNLYQWQPKNGCGYHICGDRYWKIPLEDQHEKI